MQNSEGSQSYNQYCPDLEAWLPTVEEMAAHWDAVDDSFFDLDQYLATFLDPIDPDVDDDDNAVRKPQPKFGWWG